MALDSAARHFLIKTRPLGVGWHNTHVHLITLNLENLELPTEKEDSFIANMD